LIPGFNDGSHIPQMINFLKGKYPGFKDIHLLPYHNIASHKYERFGIENRMGNIQSMKETDAMPVADTFTKAGYNVTTGG